MVERGPEKAGVGGSIPSLGIPHWFHAVPRLPIKTRKPCTDTNLNIFGVPYSPTEMPCKRTKKYGDKCGDKTEDEMRRPSLKKRNGETEGDDTDV